jgi:protein SCO1/2
MIWMSSMKNKTILSVSRGVCFLLMISVQVLMTSHSSASEPPILDFGGEFTLTNHHGANTQLSDFKGKVVVMSFGFTSCPDICPVTLNQLKRLMNNLGDHSGELQNLFVTIDPKRDTPNVLKEYMEYFDPSFIGLTGKLDEIKNVARQYHSSFKRHNLSSKDEYVFGHTLSVFLVDQEGRLRGHYKIASEFKRLLKDVEILVYSKGIKKQLTPLKEETAEALLEVEGAWVRALPPTVNSTVAYMTILNKSNKADQLISIRSPLAKLTEVHESYTQNGMGLMRRIDDVVIPANGSLKLEPRGFHAMMMDIKKVPKEGEKIPLILSFRHAGDVSVYADVRKEMGVPHHHH